MNDRDKLNQLGKEWYNMPEQGNEAVRLALYKEILGLAYKLFSSQSDAMGLFFEKDWNRFDPEKGDLYGFMSSRLKRRMINFLSEKLYNMPEQGNEAARLALLEKIFVLAYKLFPRQSDAMGLFFEKDWSRFDPGKGDLYGFMSSRLKRRMIDLWRQDASGDISIDAPIDDEDDAAPREPTGGPDIDDSGLMIDERVLEVMMLMLDLKNRLGGRAGNPVRINYFRLFFTDGIVDAIQSIQGIDAFARRERDLFRAIKETFLNYFMNSPCGSVEDILDTDLKPYGQMVKGRPMEPPKQPLPNDVYTTYLEQIENYAAGDSAVSQQRTAYKTFMKEQLLS